MFLIPKHFAQCPGNQFTSEEKWLNPFAMAILLLVSSLSILKHPVNPVLSLHLPIILFRICQVFGSYLYAHSVIYDNNLIILLCCLFKVIEIASSEYEMYVVRVWEEFNNPLVIEFSCLIYLFDGFAVFYRCISLQFDMEYILWIIHFLILW